MTDEAIANAITRSETKVSEWQRRAHLAQRYSEQRYAEDRVRHFKTKCYQLSQEAGFHYQPVGTVIGCPTHW